MLALGGRFSPREAAAQWPEPNGHGAGAGSEPTCTTARSCSDAGIPPCQAVRQKRSEPSLADMVPKVLLGGMASRKPPPGMRYRASYFFPTLSFSQSEGFRYRGGEDL